MVNRQDLQALAEERLEDARVLLTNGRYGAAYYLCGYAVECGIKACIARQIRAEEFPPDRKFSDDLFTHDFARLVRRANLEGILDNEKRADAVFGINWEVVKEWSESTRYDSKHQLEAQELFDAMSDPNHGVLRWLRRHW